MAAASGDGSSWPGVQAGIQQQQLQHRCWMLTKHILRPVSFALESCAQQQQT